MKKIFNSFAVDILPASGGFIAIEKQMDGDHPCINYKYSPASTPTSPRAIMRKAFLESKFRDNHELLASKVGNYLLSQVSWIDDDSFLSMTPFDGKVLHLSQYGDILWEGILTYREEAPQDILVIGDGIWCSYSEQNTLIRYNLKTKREELRLGGTGDTAFRGPCGLWFNEETNEIFVCNQFSQNIVAINRSNYKVNEYTSFNEPVYRYLKTGPNEVVRLDSGVYII